jgi:hypothetical protein
MRESLLRRITNIFTSSHPLRRSLVGREHLRARRLGFGSLSSTILTRFTFTADLTLDGTVNNDDATVQGAFYGQVSTGTWITGDLDYDGDVDNDDVTLLNSFYGMSI